LTCGPKKVKNFPCGANLDTFVCPAGKKKKTEMHKFILDNKKLLSGIMGGEKY
jgi:hypothetical protein